MGQKYSDHARGATVCFRPRLATPAASVEAQLSLRAANDGVCAGVKVRALNQRSGKLSEVGARLAERLEGPKTRPGNHTGPSDHRGPAHDFFLRSSTADFGVSESTHVLHARAYPVLFGRGSGLVRWLQCHSRVYTRFASATNAFTWVA